MKHTIRAECHVHFWTLFESFLAQIKEVGESVERVKFLLDYPLCGAGKFRATVWTKKETGGDHGQE